MAKFCILHMGVVSKEQHKMMKIVHELSFEKFDFLCVCVRARVFRYHNRNRLEEHDEKKRGNAIFKSKQLQITSIFAYI